MVDIVDAPTRSRMMAGIKGRNTKPEIKLRRALHALGFRFRLHARGLAGRPDIVLPRWHAAIFVHGCFWHRHESCRYTTTPSTRSEFWQEKFDQNVRRDGRNLRDLHVLGWRTAVVWECTLRTEATASLAADAIADWLRSGSAECQLPAAAS